MNNFSIWISYICCYHYFHADYFPHLYCFYDNITVVAFSGLFQASVDPGKYLSLFLFLFSLSLYIVTGSDIHNFYITKFVNQCFKLVGYCLFNAGLISTGDCHFFFPAGLISAEAKNKTISKKKKKRMGHLNIEIYQTSNFETIVEHRCMFKVSL